MLEYVKNNYDSLVYEIGEMSRKAGREITLVGVTKSGTDPEVLALAECGIGDIGENRPQMLVARRELLRAGGYAPRLHEIGNLQRNKVKHIIEDVHLIHSLSSYELALEIDRQAERVGRRVPVLIEVNSAEERAKGGILPSDVQDFYLKVRELPSLEVSGLMTMGPVCENIEDIRPYFRLTRQLSDKINKTYGFPCEPILSMGMSDSYAIAIEEGATIVRVGTKLFKK